MEYDGTEYNPEYHKPKEGFFKRIIDNIIWYLDKLTTNDPIKEAHGKD